MTLTKPQRSPTRSSTGSSELQCAICRQRLEPAGELRYPRLADQRATVAAQGAEHCSACGRLGCPLCLLVVDERRDDFFLDLFLCRECLKAGALQ
jgi:hypothetical protein